MPNAYVIKCKWKPDGEANTNSGWLTTKDTAGTDRRKARVFDSLLSADCYAAAMDIQFPHWQHIVEKM